MSGQTTPTNNGNPMTPGTTTVPPVIPYGGGGGVLVSQESLGGNGKCLTTAANTNTRLCAQQGAYLVKTLRIQPCNSAGSIGDQTGTVTYGRPGLGPEFADAVTPLGSLPAELTVPRTAPERFIDLFDVWISATIAGNGVVWDCQN